MRQSRRNGARKAGFLATGLAAMLAVSTLLACGQVPEAEEGSQPSELPTGAEGSAVEKLLDLQVAAWNRGDIAAFMDGYWKSPDLRFASGGSVTRGWKVTLNRYRERYPDRATMGTLRFEDREIEMLASDHALAFGRWILDRDGDQPQGLFTLLLRRFEDSSQDSEEYRAAHGWRVVADHTSSQQ